MSDNKAKSQPDVDKKTAKGKGEGGFSPIQTALPTMISRAKTSQKSKRDRSHRLAKADPNSRIPDIEPECVLANRKKYQRNFLFRARWTKVRRAFVPYLRCSRWNIRPLDTVLGSTNYINCCY